MGYYISTQETDDIIIAPEQFEQLLNELRAAEEKNGGTLSWCKTVDEYLAPHEDADRWVGYRRALVHLLEDFGLAVANLADGEDAAKTPIVIQYWEGEKMPWSWDDVWNALGAVVTTPATWVIRGEDGEIWAHRVGSGKGHTIHGVALTVID